MEKLWCSCAVTWLWNIWVWSWGPHLSCAITLRGWNKANSKWSQGGPVSLKPPSNKPWKKQRVHADSCHAGTCYSCGESVPCIADALPHPLITEQKAVQVWLTSKSQRTRSPCRVYIAHVHTWTPFFMEMKTLILVLDPQRWRMFLLVYCFY